jgi:hypothetical protein
MNHRQTQKLDDTPIYLRYQEKVGRGHSASRLQGNVIFVQNFSIRILL